ncbi:MAG: formate--tetrahydrofolate ligase [Thermoplasmata archaeon]|jgi:formate--tetrahydrofolate ligase
MMAHPRTLRPIVDVASDLGLPKSDLIPAGSGVLKVPVGLVRSLASRPRKGRLILVSAMTPTEHGEGKTVVAIGLGMALDRLGHRSVVCLRQPSLGPVFGVKGGASGGGHATVDPRPAIDLGLTGDLDAITNAQNLVASLIDHHIYRGRTPEIVDGSTEFPRASAIEDRSLRTFTAGLSQPGHGFPRAAQFVVSAACEVAAIHALARDYVDLKDRFGRILVGRTASGAPVRAADVGAAGASASLLSNALAPNLVQTAEGTAAFVHGIPYANVAHGTCSRLAIEAGLALTDFCVVEAGFSSELGAEKFVDIVGAGTGLDANVGVLVATIRALRYHGGLPSNAPPSVAAVTKGLANLDQHVANMRLLGLDPIVALNQFPTDTPEEARIVEQYCAERHIPFARDSAYADGGKGAEELARLVVAAAKRGQKSRVLYGPTASVETVLDTVATKMYGAAGVDLSPAAVADLDRIRSLGEALGPVCIAKTPRSLSDDPKKWGRPTDFRVQVRRLERWSGAGFTVALLGGIITMPGLPEHPASDTIDITPDGRVVGVL